MRKATVLLTDEPPAVIEGVTELGITGGVLMLYKQGDTATNDGCPSYLWPLARIREVRFDPYEKP